MKKLLLLFGAIALSITTSTGVIAFLAKPEEKQKKDLIINFTDITGEITGEINHITVASNDDIYIATENTLYKSTDNGANFTPVKLEIKGKITNLAINKNDNIYVSTSEGLYKSTDNGVNFTEIKEFDNCVTSVYSIDKNGNIVGASFNFKDLISFVIDKNGIISIHTTTTTNTIYDNLSFTFAPNGDIYGIDDETIFKSTDNGASFTPVNSPNKEELSDQQIAFLKIDKNSHIYVLTMDETTSTLYKSTDNGANFTPVKLEIKGKITNLAINKNDNIYVGTNKNIYCASLKI